MPPHPDRVKPARAATFGFLEGDDPRLRASVLAIADVLTEHGYVLRYRTKRPTTGSPARRGRS
jgi:GH15 family glucan-1,4-alpha-glucosidase